MERCNGVDDDCDGALDAEDADSRPPEAQELWLDRDLDGFPGDFAVGWRCEAGLGELLAPADAAGWDCDDNEASIFPGGAELVADGIDGECDDAELAPTDDCAVVDYTCPP